MARDLIIVGCGGLAREVMWLSSECREAWNAVGWLDDADCRQGERIGRLPVLGRVSDWTQYKSSAFVIGIGSPRIRQAVVSRMLVDGDPSFATLIHESARLAPDVRIGAGAIVTAGCVLTVGVTIADHVLLNLNSTVGHDSQISSFCTIAPMVAISGNVALETCVEVGTGACVREGVRMGRGSMAGMGATVTRSVDQSALVVGNPARFLRSLEPV